MATLLERLTAIVTPVVEAQGLELFDLTYAGGTVQVTIDRPAPGGPDDGVDLGDLTAVTRAVSRALDEHDPIPDRYSLEVSSPGLERSLRTPRHFERAIGETLAVKLVAGAVPDRRVRGRLVRAGSVLAPGHDPVVGAADAGEPAADPAASLDLELDGGEVRTIAYDGIDKARTVFEWGPEPRPARGGGRSGSNPTTKQPTTKQPATKPTPTTKKVDAR